MNRRLVLKGLGAVVSFSPLRPMPAESGPTASPSILKRGVNLSHWFAQSYEPLDAAHFVRFVSAAQLARIKKAGFDHVRLCIDPGVIFEPDSATLRSVRLQYLDWALAKIAAANLEAVVDLHPVGNSKDELKAAPGADRFVARWQSLAGHLARLPSRSIVLEILNEPSPIEGDYWWHLQARALAAVRVAMGPEMPVIVNPGAWSGISDLVRRRPYDDKNLIYTVHYYSPMLFTHQSTSWSWKVATRVKGLGWPLQAANAVQVARAATNDVEAETFVRDAVASGAFGYEAMLADLDTLRKWQTGAGNVPIYIGEFGVYAKGAPREARLHWVHSARQAFEDRRFGWSFWDASDSFGFYRDPSRHEPDTGLLTALGVAA